MDVAITNRPSRTVREGRSTYHSIRGMWGKTGQFKKKTPYIECIFTDAVKFVAFLGDIHYAKRCYKIVEETLQKVTSAPLFNNFFDSDA